MLVGSLHENLREDPGFWTYLHSTLTRKLVWTTIRISMLSCTHTNRTIKCTCPSKNITPRGLLISSAFLLANLGSLMLIWRSNCPKKKFTCYNILHRGANGRGTAEGGGHLDLYLSELPYAMHIIFFSMFTFIQILLTNAWLFK